MTALNAYSFRPLLDRAVGHAGQAWRTLRRQGLISTAADVVSSIWFDLCHGLSTAVPGAPSPQEAGLPADSVPYQAASPRLVRRLLATLPAESRTACLVDYGCGKGRILVLAAEAGFTDLVGVELDPALAAEGRRSVQQALGRRAGIRVRIEEGDARDFLPPEGPLVAFFYHPFGGATLREVTRRLGNIARRHPVWVVYVHPREIATFLHAGFHPETTIPRGAIESGLILTGPHALPGAGVRPDPTTGAGGRPIAPAPPGRPTGPR